MADVHQKELSVLVLVGILWWRLSKWEWRLVDWAGLYRGRWRTSADGGCPPMV